MAMDFLSLEPNKVSRDLSGYITFLYGPPKCGKTTFGSKMPKALILAFERGYNALPGVYAQDITSWSEMKQALRQLKSPEVRQKFSSIIIDTVDIAADLCQKYICGQLNIENIGDGGWTNNGWAKYKKEFEETFRTLTQLGYAVVFISHSKEKTIKPQQGTEYQQICSSLQSSACSIIENMSDLIGYAHPKIINDVSKVVLTLRSPDNSVVCGGRFKYIDSEIDFSYEALTEALNKAIDKEAEGTDNRFVTNERNQITEIPEYDYDLLQKRFTAAVGELMSKNQSNAAKITAIVEKTLGRGKKFTDCAPAQCEQMDFIVSEIEALLKN